MTGAGIVFVHAPAREAVLCRRRLDRIEDVGKLGRCYLEVGHRASRRIGRGNVGVLRQKGQFARIFCRYGVGKWRSERYVSFTGAGRANQDSAWRGEDGIREALVRGCLVGPGVKFVGLVADLDSDNA